MLNNTNVYEIIQFFLFESIWVYLNDLSNATSEGLFCKKMSDLNSENYES